MLYCFLADGFEEIEALATVDILRRANLKVVTVGIEKQEITGAHNIKVIADCDTNSQLLFDDCEGIILPGGMPGTINLEKNLTVQDAVNKSVKNKILICAICAAPSILGHLNLLDNKNATCYPGFEKDLYGANVTGTPVVQDGNIITSRGAGCAIDFALKIVENLVSPEESENISNLIQRA